MLWNTNFKQGTYTWLVEWHIKFEFHHNGTIYLQFSASGKLNLCFAVMASSIKYT